MKKQTEIKNINLLELVKSGKVSIIDGSETLRHEVSIIHGFLTSNDIDVLVLDDIYKHPEKINLLREKSVRTLIIQSAGMNPEIHKLCEKFIESKANIKNLMLIFNEDTFLNTIWKLKDLDVYKFSEISHKIVTAYKLAYCSSEAKNR